MSEEYMINCPHCRKNIFFVIAVRGFEDIPEEDKEYFDSAYFNALEWHEVEIGEGWQWCNLDKISEGAIDYILNAPQSKLIIDSWQYTIDQTDGRLWRKKL